MNVIYEDNHIIVVEKPFNIPTQEDDSKDMDLLRMVKEYVRVKYNKPGEAYIGLVHRLDRVAGGLMVFARTSKAASRLSEQVRNRTFKKEYLAVVEGVLGSDNAHWADYLLKDSKTNTVSVVKANRQDAKEAKLNYLLVERIGALNLVQIDLLTGRPHQIRVQFSSRSHPIWGDGKYGSSYRSKKGIALWSTKIALEHPTTKEPLVFELDPPKQEPWTQFRAIKEMNL